MGLLEFLSFFRPHLKRKASSEFLAKRPATNKLGNQKRKRSIMERLNRSLGVERKEMKRTTLSDFEVVQVHQGKKSRLPRLHPSEMLPEIIASSFRGESTIANAKTDCQCCPAARSGHRIFATEDYIYLVGGYKPNGTPDQTFNDVWRFNIMMEKWEKCSLISDESVTVVPFCLASFSLVQAGKNNEAYVFGGTGVPFGVMASNDLYKICTRRNGTFELKKQALAGLQHQRPPRMYGQAMAFGKYYDTNGNCEEKVYLVGGTNGHEYNVDVWRLQKSELQPEIESTERQSTINTTPLWQSSLLTAGIIDQESGRYRLEVICYKDQLITFGGGTFGGGAPDFCAEFEELLTFDLKTQAFINLRTNPDGEHGFPRGRKCHALVEFEENAYIIGGCRDADEPHHLEMTSDVWRLNLSSMSWNKLKTSLPIPLFFHSATVTWEGCVYVFGGCTDGKSNSRSNQIFRMWLRPPTLRHITMKAILDDGCYFANKIQKGVPDEVYLSNSADFIRTLVS